jgi:hypothetical protein
MTVIALHSGARLPTIPPSRFNAALMLGVAINILLWALILAALRIL